MKLDFPHQQVAHCENGTITNLLNYHNFKITEPLIFGIGSGLFYAYMPFVKNHGIPLTSYRIMPGQIYANATKRLGIKMFKKTYKDKGEAMDELNEMVDKGQPVGLLSNLYYLPFFPKSYRFHYNAHNMIVYGREGKTYFISDPVLGEPAEIQYEDLMRARFAEGVLSVKGDMYFPLEVPESSNIAEAVVKGIKATSNLMIRNPIPYHGVTGIRMLAKKIAKEGRENNLEFLRQFLGNTIRMQEEAGTGGAGFRYLYAAFLQEASQVLNQDWLKDCSKDMTSIGDQWREFATNAGRLLKGRKNAQEALSIINGLLYEIAEREKALFKSLSRVKL